MNKNEIVIGGIFPNRTAATEYILDNGIQLSEADVRDHYKVIDLGMCQMPSFQSVSWRRKNIKEGT